MGRSPGDRDGNASLHLVEEGIDASDNMFVRNRFNGAGCKQFNTIKAIRDKVYSAVRWLGRGITFHFLHQELVL